MENSLNNIPEGNFCFNDLIAKAKMRIPIEDEFVQIANILKSEIIRLQLANIDNADLQKALNAFDQNFDLMIKMYLKMDKASYRSLRNALNSIIKSDSSVKGVFITLKIKDFKGEVGQIKHLKIEI